MPDLLKKVGTFDIEAKNCIASCQILGHVDVASVASVVVPDVELRWNLKNALKQTDQN